MASQFAPFASWEELDLHDILGEFTDEDGEIFGPESEWDVSPSSGSGVDEVEIQKKENTPKKKARKEPSTKNFFCPLCPKKYVTTAGFRGHVMKKHDRPDLKAHMHQSLEKAACDDDGPEQVMKIPLTSAEDIKEELPTITRTALEGIRDDAIHNLESSLYGGQMVDIAKHLLNADLTLVHTILFTHLIAILTSATKPGHIDISSLLRGIGKIRFNNNFLTAMCQTLTSIVPTDVLKRYIKLFIQRFISEFVTAYIRRQNELMDKIGKLAAESVTDNDKQVLFYICGYLIHALSKKYRRIKSAKLLMEYVHCLQRSETPKENDLPSSSWTNAVDRGGLTKPHAKFVNIIIQVEKWVRELVSMEHLKSDSLVNLKARLMNYKLLRVSWQNMFSNGNTSDSTLILLEHVLSLFLKVRGFAVTKLLRKTSQKQKKDSLKSKTGRSNKSLRKNLKALNGLNLQ